MKKNLALPVAIGLGAMLCWSPAQGHETKGSKPHTHGQTAKGKKATKAPKAAKPKAAPISQPTSRPTSVPAEQTTPRNIPPEPPPQRILPPKQKKTGNEPPAKPTFEAPVPFIPTDQIVLAKKKRPNSPNLRFTFTPDQLLTHCKRSVKEAKVNIKFLLIANKNPKERSFSSVVLAFEGILERMGDPIGVFWLLKATTSNKKLKQAGNKCLREYFGFNSSVFAKAGVYKLFQWVAKSKEAKTLKPEQTSLLKKYLTSFVRAGAALGPKKRKQVAAINAKIAALGMKFQSNLAQDKTMVTLTKSELEGVPASVVKALKKTKDGKYIFRVRIASMYLAFLRNAKQANVRKKVLIAYENAQGKKNSQILEQIIALRHKMATMLGYKSFAEYVLAERMAKKPKTVLSFLGRLQTKLRGKMDTELKQLLALKKKDNPKATVVNAWDWRYYLNKLKQTRYSIDDEAIRAYFPMNHVIKEVFAIYQKLLGVTFKEIKSARTWHPDVRLFSIDDNKTKKRVSYFYLDLYPRPGKYTHFAAFGFRNGFALPKGEYRKPVSSVVGNWRKPLPGQDALLSHSEVVTFFHEFGHIMHQTLTRATYGSVSGTSVKRDFVEAPSQMLENWCWQPSILKKLSKHHKTGKPLPNKLIQKMLAAKHFNSGLFWTRQLFYATIDMRLHTSGPKVDSAKIWRKTVKDIMPVAATKNTFPAGGFGHLIGYAAGYYGYLWSKVYAQDMFTRFRAKGLLDTKTGLRYRKWILEPGGSKEPIELIKGFLGRTPNAKAFYKTLGIN